MILTAAIFATRPVRGADKRIVLIAGRPSHPPGMHEFRAGALLLQKALSGVSGVTVQVYDGGWPSKMVDGARVDDNSALDTRRCRADLCGRRERQSGDSGRPHESD